MNRVLFLCFNLLCIILNLVLTTACTNSPTKQNEISHVQVKETSDTLKKEKFSFSFLKKSNFYWGKYKNENTKMLNCGNKIIELWRDTIYGFHYNYCLFNGAADKKMQRKDLEPTSILSQFVVWKNGNKIGQYHDSINERLVAIMCNYNDTALNGLNLVTKGTRELEGLYGKPDSTVGNDLFYFTNSEVLVLNIKKEKIASFYWLLLKDDKISTTKVQKVIKAFQ